MTRTNDGQNKHALLIGINDYPNFDNWAQLYGCINDVTLMEKILKENFQFPPENISLLKNEGATRDKILFAMDELIERVGVDDIVVIHYSGHGSQMTDREGDEPDGMDETIVPYDSGRSPNENRDITDDEIYVKLLRLNEKTPYVTFIFDSCHSGTITRDTFGAKARRVEPDDRPIDELPVSSVSREVALAGEINPGPSGWLPLSKRYVLIAGCHDEESSYEYHTGSGENKLVHGALTYFLSRELTQAVSGTTYRDVFEQVSPHITSKFARQHPQMEGARDRELFGIKEIEPMRFVPVTSRRASKVTLGAGAAHGMTIGSQWEIYPQNVKKVNNETPVNGLVEIEKILATSAEAKIITEENEGSILAGNRAVETLHNFGEMRFAIEISPSENFSEEINMLSEAVQNSPLLRLVSPGEEAKAKVYIIPERKKSEDSEPYGPVPQLNDVPKPIWAVIGEDGQLLMPNHSVTEHNVVSTLCKNFEKITRFRQLLRLLNPDKQDPLIGKVDFVLKRRSNNGEWINAEPANENGMVLYNEGEQFGAEITNRYSKGIYVNVLDFGLTGRVSLIHPVEGSNEKLDPGKTIKIGMRQGDELTLYKPDNFPFLPEDKEINIEGGIETLKLFATLSPTDFSWLQQEGMRSIPVTRSSEAPLNWLFRTAYQGAMTRDTRRRVKVLDKDESWIVLERSFYLMCQ